MIKINSGKVTVPEDDSHICHIGDDYTPVVQFMFVNEVYENCTHRLYLRFDNGATNFFVLDSEVVNGSTTLTWKVLEEHIYKNGYVIAQIKTMFDDGRIIHTEDFALLVSESLEYTGDFEQKIAEFLQLEERLNELKSEIEATGKDGKSAYQIALDNGFIGTEEEWLSSLCGEDGQDGKDGLDGYSPKIIVSNTETGYRFTIEHSENLVERISINHGNDGEKGETGAQGPKGEAGDDGYTPVLGVDYFTESDKAEINAENIEFMTTELAKRGQLKPEFANSVEECTDTSKLYVLPDGYIYGYMLTEVMTGGYENKAQPLPNNTTDTTKWVNNYRFSSGGISTNTGTTISNRISCKSGDVIRIKGVTLRASTDRMAVYYTKDGVEAEGKGYWNGGTHAFLTCEMIDDIYVVKIKTDTGYEPYAFRFAMPTPVDANAVIITVNEEIVEPTVTTQYAWVNTGHAFVPNEYDEEFVALSNEISQLKYGISELETANSTLSESLSSLENEIDNIGRAKIPDYWQTHLNEKIERIKALQKQGGKNAFTFPMFADTHYTSNLSKIAPLLAKEIMDKVHSKFAVDVGDAQTRGCHASKEALEEENVLIDKMFEPIRDRLLRTEGNHDGSYGKLDRDGDGVISNHYSDGTVKPYNERETYVHNLTQAELFECIYRENGLATDVHTDSSGTAFYVDDTLNKARFIVLNTHKNDYELNTDGTQKYPKMWLFHYTQEQFDFLINDALTNGLDDDWAVMVFAHCPVTQEIRDRELMQGVLKAFKNKTSYKGNYEGSFSYDAVSVDVDFSNAKGEFVGYFHGHNHVDSVDTSCGFNVIGTRCDAMEENDSTLKAQRVQGTVTEQSFDVFTVNKKERKVYATKIGAGSDRVVDF